MSTQNTDILADQGKELGLSNSTSDGVYKVRLGNHSEKMIQVRSDMAGEYRRFTEEDGKRIVFVKV